MINERLQIFAIMQRTRKKWRLLITPLTPDPNYSAFITNFTQSKNVKSSDKKNISTIQSTFHLRFQRDFMIFFDVI